MQEISSQNAIKIIDRLKKSLKIKTDIELSEFLNIKPNTISTWKKRNTVDYEAIISICDLYEIDIDMIFLGKTIGSSYSNSTPLVSKEVQFQYAKDVNSTSVLDNVQKYTIPFASENAIIFQVTSNNMFPTIEENSFVICEPLTIQNIKFGETVVIISHKKGFLINQIYNDPNSTQFVLASEDDFYPSFKN